MAHWSCLLTLSSTACHSNIHRHTGLWSHDQLTRFAGAPCRFAAIRTILAQDGPGLQYIRRQIKRREEEVRAGRLGIYADESKHITEEVRG